VYTGYSDTTLDTQATATDSYDGDSNAKNGNDSDDGVDSDTEATAGAPAGTTTHIWLYCSYIIQIYIINSFTAYTKIPCIVMLVCVADVEP
jgi:hypothetical protein